MLQKTKHVLSKCFSISYVNSFCLLVKATNINIANPYPIAQHINTILALTQLKALCFKAFSCLQYLTSHLEHHSPPAQYSNLVQQKFWLLNSLFSHPATYTSTYLISTSSNFFLIISLYLPSGVPIILTLFVSASLSKTCKSDNNQPRPPLFLSFMVYSTIYIFDTAVAQDILKKHKRREQDFCSQPIVSAMS